MPSPVALRGVSKIVRSVPVRAAWEKPLVAVNLAVALSKLGQRVPGADGRGYVRSQRAVDDGQLAVAEKIGEGNMIELKT